MANVLRNITGPALALALGALLASCGFSGKSEAKAPAPPPPTVYVEPVVRRDLPKRSATNSVSAMPRWRKSALSAAKC